MTNDIEELTKNLKQENRKCVSALEQGQRYLLRFNVDGLKLEEVEKALKDIRKNVPKKHKEKRVYIQLDGVVDFV